MVESELLEKSLQNLTIDLQVFINLSFQKERGRLREWIDETVNRIDKKCWEAKQCNEENCPAFRNECGRCWLIAGTMCGGEAQGKMAQKYDSCTTCDFFQKTTNTDPVRKLRELVIILIHSLRTKQHELNETQSELKILSGLLPTCMHCKKIRDEEGEWNQLEAYISQRSEANFSHGICPECLSRRYPELDNEFITKE